MRVPMLSSSSAICSAERVFVPLMTVFCIRVNSPALSSLSYRLPMRSATFTDTMPFVRTGFVMMTSPFGSVVRFTV